jgi:thiol-disulfide isomerase/thioredoxin
VNKKAPSLAHAVDAKGRAIDTKKFEHKVIVIDFWATWCGPCNAEFPHMQKIYDKFKDNPDVKFMILDSGFNNKLKDVKQWISKNDYTFPIYYDDHSKISTAFGVRALPTIAIIGKNGKIQFKDAGYKGPAVEKILPLKINMALKNNYSSEK